MRRTYPLLLLFTSLTTLYSCKSNTVPYTQDGNWVTVSAFNGANRSEAVSFTIADLAYVSGGWDGVRRYNDMWSFDPSGDGNWIQLASMPATNRNGGGTARSSAVGFAVGNEGYVGTGYDGYNYLSDFWKYDVASNTWTQVSDFGGGPRYEAVAFGIDSFGYVTTGYDGLNAQKDFWQYSPALDTWKLKFGMGGDKRYSAVCWTYNNMAYVVTGLNSGSAVGDFWRYDPSQADTSAWTQLNHIYNFSTASFDDGYTTIERWNAAAFVIQGTADGDCAFVTTGENGSLYALTWEYIIKLDLWKEKTPFEGVPRTGAIGITVRNQGYAGLGRTSSQPLDDIRQFFPNEVFNAND